MKHVLITVSRGIIDQVISFEDPALAVQALSDYVKEMNPEYDDAALYDTLGLIANAKHFLDEHDRFRENNALIKEVSKEGPRPIYIIANPNHPLGFMVTSPDDLLGYTDPAEAVSDLGQMRKDYGNHLKLYRVARVKDPVVQKTDLEKHNANSDVEAFDYSLVKEYVL
ncbi:MAG: hypothetical protein JRL30_11035 [Deltaproteobacteria bacterium]|nr:hypothetical protein [Deltaproteobacteria bacterium]